MALLTGWPTDSGDGSVSTEARWRKMARLWAPSGVVDGYLDRLDPDYDGLSTVTVGAGAAWVDGHYCEQLTSSSVSITSNGLVVIRWTPAANTFELLYRDGATSPTQTEATWELPLAQMSGGAMTDLREFVTRGTITTSMIDPGAVTASRMAGSSVTAFIETGGNVDNDAVTLTGSYQQVVQSTFTKPSAWVSYEITVWGSVTLDASSTGPATVRASGGGGNHGTDRPVLAGASVPIDLAARAKFTGLTGVSQECSMDAKRDSGSIVAQSAIVSWLAIRTT